uniref:Uncharacterized protein n=1 Tax=Arundo donax TaxID=35708 RepID=A0A0A9HWC3_ARUDO
MPKPQSYSARGTGPSLNF